MAEKQRINKELAQSIKNYEAALRLFQKESYEKAAELFQKMTESTALEVASRARIYLSVCEKKLHPANPELKSADDHYEYGVMRLNDRALESALEHLARADKLQPDQDHIKFALAAAHSLSGNLDAAIEALGEAVRLNPTNSIHARRDEDFRPLEEDPRFQELVAGKRL